MSQPSRSTRRQRLRLVCAAVLSLLPMLKGCHKPAAGSGGKSAGGIPTPGVSEALRYPVLLIGQNALDVRDSEEELITTYGYASLNFVERVILDSDGRLFEVTDAVPEPGGKSWILDMGTSPRRYAVTLREKRRSEWPKVRQLLLDQVKAPNSFWEGDAKAVAKVESLNSVAEAIEACRTSWEWRR